MKPLTAPNNEQVKLARENAQLTQTDAATQVHTTTRAWQYWEAGDREMPLATWELFLLKTEQWPPSKKLLSAG